eukprot:459802_1
MYMNDNETKSDNSSDNNDLNKSIATPKNTNNGMNDPLLSAKHDQYNTANNDNETKKDLSDDDKSTVVSGFNTTTGTTITKRRRKSTFINQPAATVFSSVMNLCNTVIGAGILGLPETMTHTGWLLGFVLLIIFAGLAQTTLHLAMMAAHTLKVNENNIRVSYLTMCQNTVPRLTYLVDFSVGMTCFGVCCAYLVVIGDLMPDVAAQIIDRSHEQEAPTVEKVLESRQFWIVVFLIVVCIPTARLKKIDSLRFTSTAAIVCFTYVTIIVVLYAFIPELDLCDPDDPERFVQFCENTHIHAAPIQSAQDLLKFFKAAPVIIFAFTCHQNAFSVTNELQIASKTNLNKTLFGSISFCCVVYCMVSFSGYWSFGESAPSNLLTAYPKSIPILIVRICLSLAIAFSYPVLAHPARNSFSSLIFQVADSKELNWIAYNSITWTIVLLSFTISMITDDLGIVLGLVGATGTTVIAFILPGLFYFYLPQHMLEKNQPDTYKWKRYVALSMVVLGCLFIPFAVTMLFVD